MVNNMVRKQIEPRFKDGWGETIREIREYRGYSQEFVAKKLGISQATLSKWEREVTIPTVYSAFELADLLKIDAITIFSI